MTWRRWRISCVIGGDSCDDGFYGLQALFDADTTILNGVGRHPLARIVSNSWEGNDESQPLNLVKIEHAYLLGPPPRASA